MVPCESRITGANNDITEKTVKVRILRHSPEREEDGRWVEYEVPDIEGASVSNVLEYIRCNLDRSLAYYLSCRIGKCQGCLVKVNGRVTRACTEPATGEMTIEPLDRKNVVKDLVVESRRKEPEHV